MTKVHTIGLPNGKSCSVAKYCAAIRTIKAMAPTAQVAGFGHFGETAEYILRRNRQMVHELVSRHIPGFGKGRKWSWEWQTEMSRAARALNYPRLVVRWVPAELMRRPTIRERVESSREY